MLSNIVLEMRKLFINVVLLILVLLIRIYSQSSALMLYCIMYFIHGCWIVIKCIYLQASSDLIIIVLVQVI